MAEPELIEVKADCPFCGSKRFSGYSRFVFEGHLRIKRRCRDCGKSAWVKRVLMSEVKQVVCFRRSVGVEAGASKGVESRAEVAASQTTAPRNDTGELRGW
jgi:hypothetical protein